MRQLPFTKFGVRLYEQEDIGSLIKDFPLKLINIDEQRDKTISKMGEVVDRLFYTYVLKRL